MGETNRRTFLSWLSGSGLAVAAVGIAGVGRAAAERDVLVLHGGTLIDGTGSRPRPNATIVVVGDRIAAVGHHGQTIPAGVRVVDLRGKFVVPGLWDMHTHTFGLDRIYPALYVANGVTGIREMWGTPLQHALRARIEAGELIGPRMVLASSIIDGPDSTLGQPPQPSPTQVRTVAEAREAVRTAAREGADFVKVYSFLREDTLAAIAGEARLLGLPFAGHLPDHVRAARASRLGIRTMEHLFGLPIDASRERDRFREIIATTPVDPAAPRDWLFMVRELERRAHDSYDPRRAAELFAALAHNGTAIEPTFTVLRLFNLPPQAFPDDPRMKYLPGWVLDVWKQALGPPWTPEQIEAGRRAWTALRRLTADLAEAGVRVLAGTDTALPFPHTFPGFSLHDELDLLVQAGVTPMRAIQAATSAAARAAGLGHVTGTVAPGKAADLLVVDADPLRDIRNTQRIHAIVHNGRLIDRAARERMLAEIEAEAGRTPPPTVMPAACACVASSTLLVGSSIARHRHAGSDSSP